jgi:hypothetical protein
MQPAPHDESIIIKQAEKGAGTGRASDDQGSIDRLGRCRSMLSEGCRSQNIQNNAFLVT